MSLNEEYQDNSRTFHHDEIQSNEVLIENNDFEVNKNQPSNENNLDKKNKHKFAKKFSAGTKLIFWIIMLILALILGGEAIWVAIQKINLINDNIADENTWNAIGNSFAAIFLWIGALFYLIIIIWSLYSATKNGIIYSKNKEHKIKSKDKTKKSKNKTKKSKNTN